MTWTEAFCDVSSTITSVELTVHLLLFVLSVQHQGAFEGDVGVLGSLCPHVPVRLLREHQDRLSEAQNGERTHVFPALFIVVLIMAEDVVITLLPTGASCAGQDEPYLQRCPLLLRERVLPRRRLAFPDRTEICGAVRQEEPMNNILNIISIRHSTCQMPLILVLQAIQICFGSTPKDFELINTEVQNLPAQMNQHTDKPNQHNNSALNSC